MAGTIDRGRRHWLAQVLLSGVLGPGALALAEAGSTRPIQSGVRRLHGELLVDGVAVAEGAPIAPGQRLETAAEGQAVVVVERAAYLLRGATRMRLQAVPGGRPNVELEQGRLLSVFEPGARQLRTPTALVEVRGTGLYLEVQAGGTYVCLCYGGARLVDPNDPRRSETLQTRHHEAPRLVGSADWVGRKVTVVNHTDAELELLEGLVGRRPPFDDPILSNGY